MTGTAERLCIKALTVQMKNIVSDSVDNVTSHVVNNRQQLCAA